jgi:hypothetical protein
MSPLRCLFVPSGQRACLAAALVLLFPAMVYGVDGLKPHLIGLIAMGGVDADNRRGGFVGSSMADVALKPNAFDGVVINVTWAQLQPTGPNDLDVSAIEKELDLMRQYNRSPGITVPLRSILRVWQADNAPDWAKRLDGPPVTLYYGNNPSSLKGKPYTVGRFWMRGYHAAWCDLQAKLAARYDSEPLIVEVSDTDCTLTDDEPFAPYSEPGTPSLQNLRDAGFGDAVFFKCLADSVDDYGGWKTTYVNFTFNPAFVSDGLAPGDNLFRHRDSNVTISIMKHFRARLGPRAVLANHNLCDPPLKANLQVDQAMTQMGPPIEFQTHSPAGLDWPGMIQEALALGSQSVELWNKTNYEPKGPHEYAGFVDVPLETLIEWSNTLKKGSPAKPGQ